MVGVVVAGEADLGRDHKVPLQATALHPSAKVWTVQNPVVVVVVRRLFWRGGNATQSSSGGAR